MARLGRGKGGGEEMFIQKGSGEMKQNREKTLDRVKGKDHPNNIHEERKGRFQGTTSKGKRRTS